MVPRVSPLNYAAFHVAAVLQLVQQVGALVVD
jgi:hypothetical protein